jgi:hypothetical protein
LVSPEESWYGPPEARERRSLVDSAISTHDLTALASSAVYLDLDRVPEDVLEHTAQVLHAPGSEFFATVLGDYEITVSLLSRFAERVEVYAAADVEDTWRDSAPARVTVRTREDALLRSDTTRRVPGQIRVLVGSEKSAWCTSGCSPLRRSMIWQIFERVT